MSCVVPTDLDGATTTKPLALDAAQELPAAKGPHSFSGVRASKIRSILDDRLIGQDEAKERLSFLISMYLSWDSRANSLYPPPNGVIVGPTGSGKTYSTQVASAALGVPFLTIDSTTLVPAGAVNGNPIGVLRDRIEEEVEPWQKCIVFLDEFDKIATKDLDNNKSWKMDIQRGLLKFIEGQGSLDSELASRRALVLVGGAFIGIDAVENYRKRKPEVAQLLRRAPKGTIVSDDLINFGFLPELIARLPAVIQFEALSEEILLGILKHPTSSPLRVWEQHFQQLGKTFKFSDKFLTSVARRAAALGLGARGLQQIVFPALARRAFAFEATSSRTIDVTEQILEFDVGSQIPVGDGNEQP